MPPLGIDDQRDSSSKRPLKCIHPYLAKVHYTSHTHTHTYTVARHNTEMETPCIEREVHLGLPELDTIRYDTYSTNEYDQNRDVNA